MNEQIVRAFTPYYLSTLGALVAISCLAIPGISFETRALGFGISSALVGGASGLSRQGTNQNIKVDDIEVNK
jgi:hypothetical protein